jgi:hypothetical protein
LLLVGVLVFPSVLSEAAFDKEGSALLQVLRNGFGLLAKGLHVNK